MKKKEEIISELNIKYNYATNFLKHDELVTFPAMDIFAAQESERVNKHLQELLEEKHKTLLGLQEKLSAAEQALETAKDKLASRELEIITLTAQVETEAVSFAGWLANSGFASWDEGKTWFKINVNKEVKITTTELYSLYKNRNK